MNGFDDQIIGPAKSLAVGKGDTVNIEVYAKYNQTTNNTTTLVSGLAAAVNDAFGLVGSGETQVAYDAISSLLSAGSGLVSSDDDIPLAYVNYLLFNEDYLLVDFGYQQVSTTALNSPHEQLSLTAIAPQNGFAYIYVTNESALDLDVFFDDLKITHVENPIIQETHYYPYGLSMRGIGKEGSNPFKYNGFEEQEELDLGLYDYQARYYDPALGRFINVDPAADLMRRHSPYNYAFDNPIRFIDPDGMMPSPHDLNSGQLSDDIEEESFSRFNFDDNRITPIASQGGGDPVYSGPDGNGQVLDPITVSCGCPGAGQLTTISPSESTYLPPASARTPMTFSQGVFHNAALGDPEAIDILKGSIGHRGTFDYLFELNRAKTAEWYAPFALSVVTAPLGFLGRGASSAAGINAERYIATRGSYSVYQGLDASGTIRYVGITSRAPQLRFAEHFNSFGTGKELLNYRVVPGATNLSRKGARVWEQGLINQYGLGKNGGQLLNKINSIRQR